MAGGKAEMMSAAARRIWTKSLVLLIMSLFGNVNSVKVMPVFC